MSEVICFQHENKTFHSESPLEIGSLVDLNRRGGFQPVRRYATLKGLGVTETCQKG